ncbi:MAG: class I SAM-dependent methyltransferase [Bacteroidetes bacterium]|nr:class I SAM-dependent methyltransferase [Bacteroidota bacterium]
MQERHRDRNIYFSEQEYTTKKYVIPFINNFLSINSDVNVLEIGCGEGGNLKPFLDLGCKCVGLDLSQKKIELGKQNFKNHPNNTNLKLFVEDIYKVNQNNFQFDLIIIRDVIEHIPYQEKFMEYVKKFLRHNGKIFFAFPPWHNPFGGHQQICYSKISLVPFIHLLPKKIYRFVLKCFEGENLIVETNNTVVKELMDIRETRISIERFRKILKQSNYKVYEEILYFINPNYEIKFKLRPRKLPNILAAVPFIRNFYTTAVYCIAGL